MRAILLTVTLVLAVPAAAAAVPDTATAVPVLLASPACKYKKLGSVRIEAGTRISESTRDQNLPAVNYRRAFAQLADAAQAKGANAVVVYWHQAVFFTSSGRRTPKPVYVRLNGGAIHYEGETGQCRLALADPDEFSRRAGRGEPVNVTSDDLYSGE